MLREYLTTLKKLRAEASEFTRLYKEFCPELDLHDNVLHHPDSERLIEALAFFSARIHVETKDRQQRLAQMMIWKYFPELLMPYPAGVIVKIDTEGVLETLPPNISVGDDVRFFTQEKLEYAPITITNTELSLLSFSLICKVDAESINGLELFVNLDVVQAESILYYLHTHRVSIDIIVSDLEHKVEQVLASNLSFDFIDDDFHPSVLIDYFCFPQQFHFFKIENFNVDLAPDKKVTIKFKFNKSLPESFQLDKDTFLFNCVTARNIYQATAEPIRLMENRSEYPLLVDTSRNDSLYSIKHVYAYKNNASEKNELSPWHCPSCESNQHYGLHRTWFSNEHSIDTLFFDETFPTYYETIIIECSVTQLKTAREIFYPGQLTLTSHNEECSYTAINVTQSSFCYRSLGENQSTINFLQSFVINAHELLTANALKQLLYLTNFPKREYHLNLIESIHDLNYKLKSTLNKGVHQQILKVTLNFKFEAHIPFVFCCMLQRLFKSFKPMNTFVDLQVMNNDYDCYRISEFD